MAKKHHDADYQSEVDKNPLFVEEYLVKPTFDEDGVQASSAIGRDGKEYGDPVPMAPPVGFDSPPDLMEMMRTMIRNDHYQRRLDEEGFDTFEEAGDFDVDEDPMPLTIHEALLTVGPPAVEPAAAAPAASPSPPVPAGPANAPAGPEGAPSPAPASTTPRTETSTPT